jgi:hypothetical protein
MKIVVIDFELPDYTCSPLRDGRTFEPLNENEFKEWLSWMDKERIKMWLPSEDSEIYFVDVKDKTWKKFRTKNSKRVQLTLDELLKLINESSFLILIKGNHAELCTRRPKDDDP